MESSGSCIPVYHGEERLVRRAFLTRVSEQLTIIARSLSSVQPFVHVGEKETFRTKRPNSGNSVYLHDHRKMRI